MDAIRKRLLSQLLQAKEIEDPVLRDRAVQDALLDLEVRADTKARRDQAHADFVSLCRGSQS